VDWSIDGSADTALFGDDMLSRLQV
jgi:hypothetical protein